MTEYLGSAFHLAVLAAVIGAAVQDFRTRTISNLWPLAILILFVPAYALDVVPGALWSHGLHFLIALGVGMALFALGWFGGGDAKLYAAIALWFDLGWAIPLFLFVALAGVILAVLHIMVALLRRSDATRSRSMREGKIAYGVAIALGAAAMFIRVY